MIWRAFRCLYYMGSVLSAFVKDLIWEELSFEEIHLNYLFGKAHAYDQAHFFGWAVGVYEKILKRDATSIPAFLSLGGLYYRRGMYEKAITQYEKVISINPKHYQGHYWLAMCYWKMKRYYAAIHTLEEVTALLPTFKDALNLMGECYEQIGEAAKAEHYYLKAISANPEQIIIHGALLQGTQQKKRREERVKN